jgi:DNA-binding PadR family transcriptional regulator
MSPFEEHGYGRHNPGWAQRAHGHFGPGWGPTGFGFGAYGSHGPHSHRSWFGPGGRGRRGMLRSLILQALAKEPMHGYQIIQHLEERSGGMWRPSAGSVYPTLQLLEDQGLVKSEEVEGRRIYSLTDEGRAEAEKAEGEAAEGPWAWFAEKAKDPRVKLGTKRRIYQLLAEGV